MRLPVLAGFVVVVVAAGLGYAIATAPANSSSASSADGNAAGSEHEHHHILGPEVDVPINAATQRELNVQLSEARAAVKDIHTAADALTRGYFPVTVKLAYLGVHYMNPTYVGKPFNPAHPTHLIFANDSPNAALIGLMYYVQKAGAPPVGFVGPNDLWHVHLAACMNGGYMLALDDISSDQCTALGGTMTKLPAPFAHRWMLHAWIVPGQKNPWGLFAHGNPAVT